MKFSKVTIRPYVEPKFNMGLEKYNQALFDGAKHTYEMAAIREGDTVRFRTGIDPYAPSVMKLDDESRTAKQKEIKKIVIEVEGILASNIIRENDAEWWNKVKRLKPDNVQFWSSDDMKIVIGNDPLLLEPSLKNPLDLLKYLAIKAGGYPEIASSYEDAASRNKAPKFYLDELESTASIKTEVAKLRNRAGAILEDLYKTNVNKLLYVCKVVDPNSTQYRKSTPNDIMYDNMDKYINGETVESDKRKTAKHFIETAELDMETLQIRALIKDATFYKYIAIKGDGMIYEMETGTAMGKNQAQVVEFLKNPLHEDVWKRLMSKVENHWKQ